MSTKDKTMALTKSDREFITGVVDDRINNLAVMIGQQFSAIDKRFDRLEVRMTSLEVRMTSLEARMDSLEARMDSLEARMTSLESDMAEVKLELKRVEIRSREDSDVETAEIIDLNKRVKTLERQVRKLESKIDRY